MLVERGRKGDRAAALEHTREALEVAAELGMNALAAPARELEASLHAGASQRRPARE
jgi:hypothetical protein